jgi:nucleoside-diphosphate-sugar epimerase
MAIPDAVTALLALMDAPVTSLTTLVYNASAFSPTAAELVERVHAAFPGASVAFAPDARRQAIVDSGPGHVDDARARRDWGFQPAYDLDRTFHEYLLPNVTRHYARG